MAGTRQAGGARILAGLQHVGACWDPHPHQQEQNSFLSKLIIYSVASTFMIFFFLSFGLHL